MWKLYLILLTVPFLWGRKLIAYEINANAPCKYKTS